MLRYIYSCAVCFALLVLPVAAAQAQSKFKTSAKQAILVDFDTGAVLFEKNAQEKMPTSSMSKVMTMYMVFDALKKGTIALDDMFLVSEKAWRKGGSKMFVEVDNRVAVEDLIRGVIIQSGNDATIVLAEGLAGTEDAFAGGMTKKAKEIGMNNSNFKNASGWPDPDHYSTAEDLAILGASIIRDFPEYYSYYSETEFKYNGIEQQNRNPLLYRNMGADGIKTGHTEIGGYGLIGSGEANGRRVVLVINGLEDAKGRAQEGAKILEYGLRSFENKRLMTKGQVVTDLPVVMGQSDAVKVVAQDNVDITIPAINGEEVVLEIRYEGPFVAPIAEGEELATLYATIPGQNEKVEVPLVAAEAVAAQGIIFKTLTKLRYMVGGKGS